mmetsp:Transcript_36822/g.41887  ORF Transcript_36822/g.41887 Transcript_36822/m.41887 type:complete len:278 (+) Transcript_36822:30-863(+)
MSETTPEKNTALDDFMESISALPKKMRKTFTTVRELDYKSVAIAKSIGKKVKKHKTMVKNNGVRKKATTEMKTLQKEIKAKQETQIENANQKISLTLEAYNVIDDYVQELDAELAKFAEFLQSSGVDVNLAEELNLEHMPTKKRGRKSKEQIALEEALKERARKSMEELQRMRGDQASTLTSSSSSTKPTQDVTTTAKSSSKLTNSESTTQTLSFDLATVDPNEPVYCFCKRVSYGHMIACDNSDCPNEWFHVSCVGLTALPKGRWFCPDCNPQKKK